jgi:hypothetical protein
MNCGAIFEGVQEASGPLEDQPSERILEKDTNKNLHVKSIIWGIASIILSPALSGVVVLILMDKWTGLVNLILLIASLSAGILAIYYGVKAKKVGSSLWLVGTIMGAIGILLIVGGYLIAFAL